MWIILAVLVLVSAGLLIYQLAAALRERRDRVAAEAEGWSPEQRRVLTVIRVGGAIGVATGWGALVYVLIDTGGWHLLQPWQNRVQAWVLVYLLYYTSVFVGQARKPARLVANAPWRPSLRLGVQALVLVVMLFAILAGIADMYLPPPSGSRPM
jgi:hypothetical protein